MTWQLQQWPSLPSHFLETTRVSVDVLFGFLSGFPVLTHQDGHEVTSNRLRPEPSITLARRQRKL